MWNSAFMKAIRWILFIPLCILVLGLILYLLALLAKGVASMNLSVFWLIMGLFVVGGLLWSIFGFISMGISFLTISFCPDKKVGSYIFSILTAISFIYYIIQIWTAQENLHGNIIVFCLVMTVLYVQLGFIIIIAALSASRE